MEAVELSETTERFREETLLFPWLRKAFTQLPLLLLVWAAIQLLAGGGILGMPAHEYAILIVISFILAAAFQFGGRMIVTVDDSAVTITFGHMIRVVKRIPFSEIVNMEPVKFNPILNFGGWGLRIGRFRGRTTGCYNLRRNRGVLLTLRGKTPVFGFGAAHLIIGSVEPETLARAVGGQPSCGPGAGRGA